MSLFSLYVALNMTIDVFDTEILMFLINVCRHKMNLMCNWTVADNTVLYN